MHIGGTAINQELVGWWMNLTKEYFWPETWIGENSF